VVGPWGVDGATDVEHGFRIIDEHDRQYPSRAGESYVQTRTHIVFDDDSEWYGPFGRADRPQAATEPVGHIDRTDPMTTVFTIEQRDAAVAALRLVNLSANRYYRPSNGSIIGGWVDFHPLAAIDAMRSLAEAPVVDDVHPGLDRG
jgi:hypothetical protein